MNQSTLIGYLAIGIVIAELTRLIWTRTHPDKKWRWGAWQIIAFSWPVLVPIAFIQVLREKHAEKIQAAKERSALEEGRLARREKRHKETDQ